MPIGPISLLLGGDFFLMLGFGLRALHATDPLATDGPSNGIP